VLSEQAAANGDLVDSKIELVYDPHLEAEGLNETELQKEQLKKYRALDSTLDKLEKTVGHWNPRSKYTSVWQAVDQLCELTEVLENRAQVDEIGKAAKELNKELDTLLNRFKQAKPIEYDHTKIDFLYQTTEKAFESGELVTLVTERLRALEQIHEDSTTLPESFEDVEQQQAELEAKLTSEAEMIRETKESMVRSVKEIQEALQGLTKVA
jgi:methyl-accepting chemotaxis protein